MLYKYPLSNLFLAGSWGGWTRAAFREHPEHRSTHNRSNHTHGQFRPICQENMRAQKSSFNPLDPEPAVRHNSSYCATNYNQSFSVITQEETASLKSVSSSLSLLTNSSGSFLITFPILHQFPFSSARVEGTKSGNGTFTKFIAALKTTLVSHDRSTQKSDQKNIPQNTCVDPGFK